MEKKNGLLGVIACMQELKKKLVLVYCLVHQQFTWLDLISSIILLWGLSLLSCMSNINPTPSSKNITLKLPRKHFCTWTLKNAANSKIESLVKAPLGPLVRKSVIKKNIEIPRFLIEIWQAPSTREVDA